MIEFWQLAQQLYEKGKEYAGATAKWEMLAESRKSLIAKLSSNEEGSEATRERLARSSDEYKQYLAWVRVARQRQLELKYEVDSIVMQFDYYRSTNSMKKKEMQIL